MYCVKFLDPLRGKFGNFWKTPRMSRMQPKLTSSEVASGDMSEMRLHVSAEIFLMGFVEPFGVGHECPRQLRILSHSDSRIFLNFHGECICPAGGSSGCRGSGTGHCDRFEYSNSGGDRAEPGGYVPADRHRETGHSQCPGLADFSATGSRRHREP